jgi:phosphoenolpyruvate carboxylase
MALRRGGLRVLHRQQLALLKEWRGNNQPNNPQSNANPPSNVNPQSNAELLNRLLLSVNAIASGLGATG